MRRPVAERALRAGALAVAFVLAAGSGCDRGSRASTVSAQPEDVESLVELGEARMQQAREEPDAGHEQLAQQLFERAVALEPTSAPALAGLAWVTGFRHEFERSAEYARKALATDPENLEAHGLLGDAALELGQDELAREHYQAMLDLRPDLASYGRAAELLYRSGDARGGIELMRKAVEVGSREPEHTAWARARLARMLWGVGNVLVAERTLAPALERAPDHIEVLLAQGLVATARKDWDVAFAAYERARAISPRHEALVALVDLARVTGRETGSSVEMIEALGGDTPGTPDADLQMARFWADHDRNLAEAVRRAEAAYAARKTPAASDTLAWCYLKVGRSDDAAPLAEWAVARRPADGEMLYHAGLIAAARGDRALAQQHLYRALSINPSFHVVHAARASEKLAELGRGIASRPAAEAPAPAVSSRSFPPT